jgi:hypothetical protein
MLCNSRCHHSGTCDNKLINNCNIIKSIFKVLDHFDDSFCRSCNFDKYISIEVVTSMAKFVEAITSMIYFVEVVTSMTYLVEVITSMINLVEAVTSMVKVVEVITSTKILSKLNFDKNTNFDTTYTW